MDREFLTGLVAKHVSGLELLPGSDQFDRPTSADGEVIENVLQLLSNRYEYIVVDGGAQITAASLAALYMAEMIAVVINPDVPSFPNGQRLIERIGQMGSCENEFACSSIARLRRLRFRWRRSKARSARRSICPSPATTGPWRRRSTQGMPVTFGDNSDMADRFKRLTGLIMRGSAPRRRNRAARCRLVYRVSRRCGETRIRWTASPVVTGDRDTPWIGQSRTTRQMTRLSICVVVASLGWRPAPTCSDRRRRRRPCRRPWQRSRRPWAMRRAAWRKASA